MISIILWLLISKLKHYKKLASSIDLVISVLDDNTLNKVKRKCEAYTTYTIDSKQINSKNKIKTKQKEVSFLLDKVNLQLALNQFELNANKVNSDTIKSTFDENNQTAEGEPAQVEKVKESKKEHKK